MSLKVRELASTGNPRGQSSWFDMGDQTILAASTVSTAVLYPIQLVPIVDTQLADGSSPGDVPPAGDSVSRLNGAQVNFVTALAAAIHFNLGVQVVRTMTLGTAVTASVAITQVTLGQPLIAPMASGATFVVTNAAGTAQTFTTSQIAPAGSTVVLVNSVTPGAAYAVGNPVVFLVGNGPAFGWVAGAAAGTPTFGAKQSVSMPPIAANTALVTPVGGTGSFLLLAQGDRIEASTSTDSSTVTMPAGILQTLVI